MVPAALGQGLDRLAALTVREPAALAARAVKGAGQSVRDRPRLRRSGPLPRPDALGSPADGIAGPGTYNLVFAHRWPPDALGRGRLPFGNGRSYPADPEPRTRRPTWNPCESPLTHSLAIDSLILKRRLLHSRTVENDYANLGETALSIPPLSSTCW
jgi:hypothetical protein